MPHQIVVPSEGDKAFFFKLRRPLFLELRDLAHVRQTSLTAVANEAIAQYLEREKGTAA